MVLAGASELDSSAVVARLRGAVERSVSIDGVPFALRVSIGTVLGSGACTGLGLVHNADVAMDIDKRARKGEPAAGELSPA